MPLTGTIAVMVTSASGLQACDSNGLSDPYVQLLVEPEEAMVKQTGGKKTGYHKKAEVCESLAAQSKDDLVNGPSTLKTTIKKKTLDPVWNELLKVRVTDATGVKLVVFDWDRIGSNDLCGQARLDLAELGLINQRPVDHVLDLAPQGTLNIQIEFIDDQTLFGLDLTSVISREASADGVPHLVKEAIRHVELDDGLETSGIYRVPGSLSAVKALKNTFCDDPLTSLAPALPQNDVCSFLKLYFREMPEPLFTNALFAELIIASKQASREDHTALQHCLQKLPGPHIKTAVFLFKHLARIMAHSDTNKMTAKNLATCFGPTLLTPTDTEGGMADISSQNRVVEYLLEFPDILESLDTSPGHGSNTVSTFSGHVARSMSEIHEEQDIFDKFADNGKLSKKMFRVACYSFGVITGEADFQQAQLLAVARMDPDAGMIDFLAFAEWIEQSSFAGVIAGSKLRQAKLSQTIEYFHFFDKGAGFLGPEAFGLFHQDLMHFRYELPADPVVCFGKLDENGNGQVELDEFLLWMLSNGYLDV